MSDLGQQIIQRVLAKGNLPALSTIAVRLMQMAADDMVSVSELAELISQDPGLATRLLRLVNSVAYRRGDEVASVQRAVALLGLNEVRVLALSVSLKDALPAKGGGHDYNLFWRTSLHRAILARHGAAALGMPNPEEAFVAGLITEIGLPLLLRVLSPQEAEGFPGFEKSLRDQVVWAHRALGVDHRQLGRAVLSFWGLPEVLHDSQRIIPPSTESSAPPMALLCDFARRAAESFFAPGADLEDVHRVAKLRFGWSAEEANQLLFDSLSQAGEVAEAMEIDLDQEHDIGAVLEKARQTIIELRARMVGELRLGGPGRQQAFLQFKSRLLGLGGLARKLAEALSGKEQTQAAEEELLRLDQALAQIEAALAQRA
ncbi:putative signal transduction protein [Desulfarculus baarsii DSM 2075]|uniref:Signal transduction protein n=1 Tax=Desulfarculus baarsii (strain ATCC 33931 / DSM 2075 / LMG 7858 / VKM B-1802 / 2st14) TaxID=644282 RepID=E1QF91_DESB2|nr:HDOD domain-containing protein [Desulfarculus baarsii]ADK84227.1 putative signal transduction protein [Desulfarculus baarsii DSM 2075]